uniref:Uncharacterized protein n=1 Tax=Candidatus Kentrum sp. MB TaxID=2138164 RepID=A0A450XEK1_9GAMM|nr:MAG: hypothetical protein BECKMB1821G_GA0114241_100139 [Candidatus Kentron sp. MB]VFK27701.1 MAG: hypothetical protein BECKMB1821I_GA0114274_100441 [Candidatus Kentron sp. MB]VFK74393.1 MAG: hypothetical protein BECKMB1821H_GA0114242_100441 [Candidatus Kentron sp. MB]
MNIDAVAMMREIRNDLDRKMQGMTWKEKRAFIHKVYIDSTIPNYYFDRRKLLVAFAEIMRQWWSEMTGEYELFVSDAVSDELKDRSRTVRPGNLPKNTGWR